MANKLIKWPKVILFGNSITQFSFGADSPWGALIADKLQRKCDVLNRGFSGYNTRWNLMILPRIIDKEIANDTAAMVIFLGANDSNSCEGNPKQHVPLEEYKTNITKMVDYVQSVGLARNKVIVVGPPPCHIETWSNKCSAEGKVMAKDNRVTGEYSVACSEAANTSGVEFVDLFKTMMLDDDWSRYLSDGLHLSAAGSMFLYNRLWPLIQKKTENLPDLILPDWKDIDHINPQASLM